MHYDNAPVGMGRASRRLHILQEPMSSGGAPAAASEGATGARPSSRWPEAEPAETAPPVDWSASGCSLLMAGGASNRALGRAFAAKPVPPPANQELRDGEASVQNSPPAMNSIGTARAGGAGARRELRGAALEGLDPAGEALAPEEGVLEVPAKPEGEIAELPPLRARVGREV